MATYPTFTKLAVLGGVGCGGTTLLLDMLRSHPRVYAGFDLGWMLATALDIDLFNTVPNDPVLPPLSLGFKSPSDLAIVIDEAVARGGDWLTFYRLAFDYLVANSGLTGRDIFIDKKPEYSGALLSHIYPKMPDVLALIVVRDPRAVYCSWRKRSHDDPLSAVAKYTMLMRGAQAALNAGKPVLLVRFEDLVLAPEPNMRRVAEFLGIDYDPAMTSPTNSYDQHIKTRFQHPPWDVENRRLRATGLDHSAIDEWRSRLKQTEAEAIVAGLPSDLAWTPL